MTPDQYRRLSILQLDETSGADAEKLIHEMAPSHFDLGPELDDTAAAKAFAEIRADIASDEIKRLWRSGHMDREGIRSGKYLDDMPDSDFATCLQILRLRERIAKWNYALSWLMGNRSPEKILLNLLPIQFSQASSLEFRISQLIRIAFEIDADRREGHNSTWRLDGIAKAELQLRMILQRDNSKFR
ncbi:hypothetical protein ASE13_14475 [Sphingomonas sp. Root241]|nr:hypothetical protein ASE13_14475 [Sphingomonas sp. Root241]